MMAIFKSLKRVWPGEFCRQLNFELQKMLGRKRTLIGFGVFMLLEVLYGLLVMHEDRGRYIKEKIAAGNPTKGMGGFLESLGQSYFDYYFSALTIAHLILSISVVFIGGLFLALVAGDIVSKEEEDGTLRMVLSRPITRGRLLAVKYVASFVFTCVLIGFAAISTLLVAFVFWKVDGGFFAESRDLGLVAFHDFGPGLWRYLISVPFLAISMMVVTSLAFMFSCFRMKPATATSMTLALLFIDIILRRTGPLRDIKHVFITSRMNSWQLMLGEEIDWWLLAHNFGLLGMICAVFFFFGWTAFSRRDFKS